MPNKAAYKSISGQPLWLFIECLFWLACMKDSPQAPDGTPINTPQIFLLWSSYKPVCTLLMPIFEKLDWKLSRKSLKHPRRLVTSPESSPCIPQPCRKTYSPATTFSTPPLRCRTSEFLCKTKRSTAMLFQAITRILADSSFSHTPSKSCFPQCLFPSWI